MDVSPANAELLDLYVKMWGREAEDVRVQHEDGVRHFHVLTFASSARRVARVVTCGLGSCAAGDGAELGVEVLLVVGQDELAEIGAARVAGFLADIGAHLLRFSVRPVEGSVIPRTSIAPWEPNALVFDLPLGEPDDLEDLVADGRILRVLWAIPVYPAEAQLVQARGMDALDALVEQSDFTLADVRRPPLVD